MDHGRDGKIKLVMLLVFALFVCPSVCCVCPSVSLIHNRVILFVCVCVCVCPPTWAGPDWIMFLNQSCNYVFVQLDQAVCWCVCPSGLDRARPNFNSQDVCVLLFFAILQALEFCCHISLDVLSCSRILSKSATLL